MSDIVSDAAQSSLTGAADPADAADPGTPLNGNLPAAPGGLITLGAPGADVCTDDSCLPEL